MLRHASPLIEDSTFWMVEALKEARLAEREGEVPIGAIVLRAGEVIGRGHNAPISRCDPSAHAEIIALREAAESVGNYRLVGTTLYTTIEPCLMCMGALLHARIRRLVFGCADPKGGAAGSLYDLSHDERLNHHVEVTGGVVEEECRVLLQKFFQFRRLW